jgi:UDP-GlcNAc:undecaprenyl-phosphate/decaprenyl-phosphate GlcNAc-1-phosphate transferase
MILATVSAFLLCSFLIFYCAPIAKNIGLVDKPDIRKGEVPPVPLIGGIMMFVSLALSSLLLPVSLQQYRYLFFSAGLLVIVGILDDHQDVPPYAKFLVQLFAASVLVLIDERIVYFVGDFFDNFPDSGSIRSQGLGLLAQPLTIVAIVALVNFVNFIDGHDGVAGFASLASLAGLVVLLLMADQERHLPLIFLMISVLSAFLCFNLPLAKTLNRRVYLGDAGSMFVGIFLAFLLIDLSQPGVGVSGWDNIVVPPPAVLWIVGIPLFDGMVVIIGRVCRAASPMKADRDHIHHRLIAAGFNKGEVVAILGGANGVFVSIAVIAVALDVKDSVMLWGFMASLLLYSLVRQRIAPR